MPLVHLQRRWLVVCRKTAPACGSAVRNAHAAEHNAPAALTLRVTHRQRVLSMARRVWSKHRVIRVLSLCGGMGSVAWCLTRVVALLKLELEVRVVEVENDSATRALASHMGGGSVEHVKPHDVWEWIADEEEAKRKLRNLGKLDAVICGFSCQDMSEAHAKGKGLRGEKSSVYFACKQMLDWAAELNQDLDFVFECTNFRRKHRRDFNFVSHDLGVDAVILDAQRISEAHRERAIWASYPIIDLASRVARPQDIMDEDRRPCKQYQHKLPTILCKATSWRHKAVVESWVNGRHMVGPLSITEVERIMGYGANSTAKVQWNQEELSVERRWRCLGNAIQAAILKHIMVSMLIARGYITRDDVRLKGQTWTVNQDGPASPWHNMRTFVKGGLSAAPIKLERHQGTPISKPTPTSPEQRTRAPTKRMKKMSGARKAMAMVVARPNHEQRVTWKGVQRHGDSTKGPELHTMTREQGQGKAERRQGQGFWEFVDAMTRDLLVISRAEATWKAYAAWWRVFVEWGCIMHVDVETASLERLTLVFQRALTLMWYGAEYATGTLEMFATAVASRIKEEGRGDIKSDSTVSHLLEGIRRKQGCAVNKKVPMEGLHI